MLLVLALTTLTSLCYASPPDPTWIAGLYDDGDHDDVVIEVVDTAAVAVAGVPFVCAPVPLHESPATMEQAVVRLLGGTAPLDRSPPLA